jgi:hypothetical protein
MRTPLRSSWGWLVALVLAAPLPLAAHALAPSLLEAVEQADGRVEFTWTTPAQVSSGAKLQPVLPPSCKAEAPAVISRRDTQWIARWTMQCRKPDAQPALAGETIAVSGLISSGSEVLLQLALLDGRHLQAVLTAQRPGYVIAARDGFFSVVRDYFELGVEHILTGWDHLAFVRDRRRLLWTITAFTGGHSITLALAALGVVHVPSAPVEAGIALSILIVAVEAARRSDRVVSPIERFPWATAAVFGLLHGLGFAGALAEVGLPAGDIPIALLFFNLGIELGQLLFIAAMLLMMMAMRSTLRRQGPAWLEAIPVYAIGALASYWLLQRTLLVFGIPALSS